MSFYCYFFNVHGHSAWNLVTFCNPYAKQFGFAYHVGASLTFGLFFVVWFRCCISAF